LDIRTTGTIETLYVDIWTIYVESWTLYVDSWTLYAGVSTRQK